MPSLATHTVLRVVGRPIAKHVIKFKGRRRGATLPHLQQSGLEAESLHTPQLQVLALRRVNQIGNPLHSGSGMESLVLLIFLLRMAICKLPGGDITVVQAMYLRKVLLVFQVAYSRAARRLCHQQPRSVRKALFTMSQLWSGSCLSNNVQMAWHCNN